MTYLHGKFVWFEHFSADVDAARRFYEALFGWKTDGVPMGESTYHMIANGGERIGGFRTAPPGVPSHWMGYVSVADVDATARAAEAAGGRVVMPPTDFPPVGRGATIADPQGAVVSVWRDREGDRPDAQQIATGDWCWCELMTSDETAAIDFYGRVLGYAHERTEMPDGPYFLLQAGGVPRAGLMRLPQPGIAPNWLPYVRVADCDASFSRVQELGGRPLHPVAAVPGVGRFAVFEDASGAALGIITPSS